MKEYLQALMRGFLDVLCSQVAVTIDNTCSGENSGLTLAAIIFMECSKSGAAMALQASMAL